MANSELHRLNQFVQDLISELPSPEGLRLVALVIVLIIPPICILTGFVGVGSLPS